MIEIKEITKDELDKYAEIPISFEVKSVLRMDLLNGGLNGLRLIEEKVEAAYWKNYDDEGEENPCSWPRNFNTDKWGFFVAVENNEYVGGAVLAYQTPEIHILEGKNDITVLWDIRVKPEYRGLGIGSALFKHAVKWSKEKGCKRIKIETQNINVAACKFYKKQGCLLGAINRYAYNDYPDEIMLIWYYEL